MDCSKVSSDYNLIKERYQKKFLLLYKSFLGNETLNIGAVKENFNEVEAFVRTLSFDLRKWKEESWRQYNPKHIFDDRALPKYNFEKHNESVNLRTKIAGYKVSIDWHCNEFGDILLASDSGRSQSDYGLLWVISNIENNQSLHKEGKVSLFKDGFSSDKLNYIQYIDDKNVFYFSKREAGIYDLDSGEVNVVIQSSDWRMQGGGVLPDKKIFLCDLNGAFWLYEKIYDKYVCVGKDISGNKKSHMKFVSSFEKNKFIQLFEDGHFEVLSPNGHGGYLRKILDLDGVTLSGDLFHFQVVSVDKMIVLRRELTSQRAMRLPTKAISYISIVSRVSSNEKYHVDDILMPEEFDDISKMYVLSDGRIIIGGNYRFGIGKLEKNQYGKFKFVLDGELINVMCGMVRDFQILPDGRLAVLYNNGEIRFYGGE